MRVGVQIKIRALKSCSRVRGGAGTKVRIDWGLN